MGKMATNVSLTLEQINKAPEKEFSKELWKPLIDYFWDRYNKRYFNQIDRLQNHCEFEIRNNCGFLMTTIDCILIETLEQYYDGKDESKGKSHDPYMSFFKRSNEFNEIIETDGDAGKFAGIVRSGLLHQSKTKQSTKINKRVSTPILEWIDKENKHMGFYLNRDKFHKVVIEEFKRLVNDLEKAESVPLRKSFKDKLKTIIE